MYPLAVHLSVQLKKILSGVKVVHYPLKDLFTKR